MARAIRHAPAYPSEFPTEAIRFARTSGKPRSEIACDLAMSKKPLEKATARGNATRPRGGPADKLEEQHDE